MINRLVCKGLVLGIIILFIGIAVQPSLATVQRNKKIITTVIENKDILNKLIEQLSDVPCDCENDDTTQRSYPVICMILFPFLFIAGILYRERLANIMGELWNRFNCPFISIFPIPF